MLRRPRHFERIHGRALKLLLNLTLKGKYFFLDLDLVLVVQSKWFEFRALLVD
jgi:hypothetical protein